MKSKIWAVVSVLIVYSPISYSDVSIGITQSYAGSNPTTTIVVSGSLDMGFCVSGTQSNLSSNVVGMFSGDEKTLQSSPITNAGFVRGAINNFTNSGGDNGTMFVACPGIGSNNPSLLTSVTSDIGANGSYGRNDAGGTFGMDNKYIYMRTDYLSGGPIGFSIIFVGKTIAELGFQVGSQSWMVGNNLISIVVSTPPAPPTPPNPIPTLTEWAQILMMLMMGGMVGWQMRRVKR